MTLCCCCSLVPVCRPLSYLLMPHAPFPSSSLYSSNFSISTRLRTKRKHIKCAFKSIFESYAKVLPPPSVWTTLVLHATHWVRPASISGCCFVYAANCGNSAKWSSLLIAHNSNNSNGSDRHSTPWPAICQQYPAKGTQHLLKKECTSRWWNWNAATLWGLNRLIWNCTALKIAQLSLTWYSSSRFVEQSKNNINKWNISVYTKITDQITNTKRKWIN